jgi:dTDP-4-amino-4,6-dideoxygalactose transaminase
MPNNNLPSISFSPPRIDVQTIAKVTEALQSGWITTGPRVKEFEKRIAHYIGVEKVVCATLHLPDWNLKHLLFMFTRCA